VTGPGGSFFNPLTNVSLNRMPDVTVKAAWDPVIGGNKLHVEAWGLYRELLDRSNFVNHSVSSFAAGGMWPTNSPRRFSTPSSRRGRARSAATADPFSDATFREDGTFQVLPILGIQGGLTWHATPTLDIYGLRGSRRPRPHSRSAATARRSVRKSALRQPRLQRGKFAGIPVATATPGGPAAHRRLLPYPASGAFGAVKIGTQYSFTQRFTFEGAAARRRPTNTSS
jgi:hypothetical protein